MPEGDRRPQDGARPSAYGGPGWSPRTASHRTEIGNLWRACGLDSEWQPLRSVLLHAPGAELEASIEPNAVQMLAPLDPARASDEHDALDEAYRAEDVEVFALEPADKPPPNQMFMADLVFMTPEGAILARPASTVRAGEEVEVARRLAALGIPILRTLRGGATFEGADALWLNPETVLIGRGLRTNAEGAAQVSQALSEIGVRTIAVDLPQGSMHLMGLLRILDRDLALAWTGRLPVAAIEVLQERGMTVAAFPDEAETRRGKAMNLVTLAPRRVLMPAGNPVSEAFLESLGVVCITVETGELAKAAGAIGCLTAVLRRDPV